MAVSQNGWDTIPSSSDSRLTTVSFQGRAGKRSFVLRKEVANSFANLLTWFDSTIEPIQSDSYGHSYRKIGSTDVWSNHSSGTAVDLNATAHPLGAKNTFTADQIEKIRRKAASLGMRWGGDYRTPDEMHFEINFKPSQLYAYTGQTPAVSPVPDTPYPTSPEPVWTPPSTPPSTPTTPAPTAPSALPVKIPAKKTGLPWSYIIAGSSMLTLAAAGLIWIAVKRRRGLR